MVHICLEATTRRFDGVVALDRVSIDFPEGSFTSLLGPSGCGKTTMLRLVAGFEQPDEGGIRFDGSVVADPTFQVPPERRGVGIVFQSYALWPHMDVAGNIGYPLATRRIAHRERERRVGEVLATVGLDGYQNRRIDELSGGQRQRVALARCLVADARIILFDEPLANLDMHLRASMVEVFREIHRRTAATMIYVTHDQAEALALSDRIAVMDSGRILQLAAPTEIYRAPAHSKVAGFVGRGSLVDAEFIGMDAGDTAVVELAGNRFAVRCTGKPERPSVQVLLRPEGLRIAESGIPARVVSSIYRGPVFEVVLQLAETSFCVVVDCVEAPVAGARVAVTVSDAWLIPG